VRDHPQVPVMSSHHDGVERFLVGSWDVGDHLDVVGTFGGPLRNPPLCVGSAGDKAIGGAAGNLAVVAARAGRAET